MVYTDFEENTVGDGGIGDDLLLLCAVYIIMVPQS